MYEINEYSHSDNCFVHAEYYKVDYISFVEYVSRHFESKDVVKSGYFLYDEPFPILFSLIHSLDKNVREQSEDFIKKYITGISNTDVILPSIMKDKIQSLSEKYDCSFNTMLINLLYQGLSSEEEIKTFYADYDRRVLLNNRIISQDKKSNEIIINVED